MSTLAVKLIPMSLIDPPDVAMRTDIDDDYIYELARSIRDNGLINAISVTRHDGRYRVEAGHCRYLAYKSLGREEIEARDYTDSGIPVGAIKGHENLMRRDPSDGELTLWLGEMQEVHHYDLETLQRITGKSEDWLAKRLSLYSGDENVFNALLNRQINLGHALVLNKFPDDFRAMYLQNCINSTPPIKVLERWLTDLKMQFPEGKMPEVEEQAPVPVVVPGITPVAQCAICGHAHSSWTFVQANVHAGCLDTVFKALQAANGGQ